MPFDAIPIYGSGMPRSITRQNHTEPQAYVRGGLGEEMDFACFSINSYFAALPRLAGSARSISTRSSISPASFHSLRWCRRRRPVSVPPKPPPERERLSPGVSMVRGTRSELLTERIRSFQMRLGEYSALWVGVLKSANSFGAFSLRVFENVQPGDKSRGGCPRAPRNVSGFLRPPGQGIPCGDVGSVDFRRGLASPDGNTGTAKTKKNPHCGGFEQVRGRGAVPARPADVRVSADP